MIDELHRFVCEVENARSEEVQLTPLSGDASTRRYFRVKFLNSIPSRTAVLMWMPELPPEGELPFINIRRHLDRCGVNVPQIYHFSKKHQCLLLEDCGDLLLERAIQGKTEKEIFALYELALEEIFKMQFLASAPAADCMAFGLAFDVEKLSWELNFFLQHTLCGFLNVKLSPAEEETLQKFFLKVSEFLAKQPRVFTHRDYHSRNLLVQDGEVIVIDFQDARLGPAVYDLVSLVKDSYADLPKGVSQKIIARYIEVVTDRFKKKISRDQFEKAWDWMTLQRSLKAAGTFGFMWRVKQNERYLPYLPRVFQFALEPLQKYAEFKGVLPILEPYLKLFRQKPEKLKERPVAS